MRSKQKTLTALFLVIAVVAITTAAFKFAPKGKSNSEERNTETAQTEKKVEKVQKPIPEVDKLDKHIAYIPSWYDYNEYYGVVSVGDKGEAATFDHELTAGIDANMTLDELAATNQEDFIKDIPYDKKTKTLKGKLFYRHNNYYLLEELKGGFHLANCIMFMSGNNGVSDSYLSPCPVPMAVGDDYAETDKEILNMPLVDELYDKCTFDEAVEFYERLDDEYYTIDKENQVIKVAASLGAKKGTVIKEFVTLDFKNKSISFKDEEGKVKYYDEKS